MPSEPPLSVRLAEQIAAQQGCEPTALTPPLNDVVDIEALERTLSTAAAARHTTRPLISFEYNGLSVTVQGGDRVDVTVEETITPRPNPPTPGVAD